MDIGIAGLGRMGAGMARRWLRQGFRVVGYNRSPEPREVLAREGLEPAESLEALVRRLPAPRAVWVMLPAGEVTDAVIQSLLGLLQPGDTLIDGGNSHFRDSQRHYASCRERQIAFLDQGTSGGIWGPEIGFCVMVGGDGEAFERVEPALRALAPEGGYLLAGPAGAGHFLKMVHNGIEYGVMQSLGEGFELLHSSEFDYDLRAVADVWNRGSVVRSWLLELLARALETDPQLTSLRGVVEDSGEGRWTVEQAIRQGVPVPAIAAALFARFRSRQPESFTAKVAAALRAQFGGHAVHSIDPSGGHE